MFGSVLSTPIINPPQSAILGMHATNMRPWVVNGQILPRCAAPRCATCPGLALWALWAVCVACPVLAA